MEPAECAEDAGGSTRHFNWVELEMKEAETQCSWGCRLNAAHRRGLSESQWIGHRAAVCRNPALNYPVARHRLFPSLRQDAAFLSGRSSRTPGGLHFCLDAS